MKLLSLAILAAAVAFSGSMFSVDALAVGATTVRIDHKVQNPKVVIWHKYKKPKGKNGRRKGKNIVAPCSALIGHAYHSDARELATIKAAFSTCKRNLHTKIELKCGKIWASHVIHADWAEERSIKRGLKTCREAGYK